MKSVQALASMALLAATMSEFVVAKKLVKEGEVAKKLVEDEEVAKTLVEKEEVGKKPVEEEEVAKELVEEEEEVDEEVFPSLDLLGKYVYIADGVYCKSEVGDCLRKI